MNPPKSKNVIVRDELKKLIASMNTNEKLPGERELSQKFGFSRMTIRQALDQLQEESLIYRVHGSGSYVSPLRLSKPMSLTSFSQEMAAQDMSLTSKVLDLKLVPAGQAALGPVKFSTAASSHLITRLRKMGETPLSLEYAYFNAELTPKLLDKKVSDSLYQLLTNLYGLQLASASEKVSAHNLTKTEAALLGTEPGRAALVFHREVYDQKGRLIEQSISIRRGDLYQLSYAVESL
ncbi:MAG: hypothetical protein RLZZ229_270 [Actinomycetota bacterium]